MNQRLALILLWAAGASLRMTVLAVPPLISQIHHGLHLDETQVGALTAMPVLLLAIAAVPGSLLVATVGAKKALCAGLLVVVIGGAARGLGTSVVVLFGMTLVMACGVAVSQPALPSLVREWVPHRIALGTASFSNGLLVGEIVAVALTASVILPLVRNNWQPALAFWSIPVAFTAAAILLTRGNANGESGDDRARWWPQWSDGKLWQVGLVLGGASLAYWGANAFLPDLLRSHGNSSLITPALTALNVVQLPGSIAVALAPNRLVARKLPLSAAGLITIATTIGLFLLPPALLIVDAGLLGFSTALVFVLALSLPPLLAEAADTHRISAGIFTISYVCPFLGSLIGGALWDASKVPETAFLPVVLGGIMVVLLPLGLDLTHAHRALIAQPDRLRMPQETIP